jgi:hypothetical protein
MRYKMEMAQVCVRFWTKRKDSMSDDLDDQDGL